MPVWDLRGTYTQQDIASDALARCNFPFDRLSKQPIPVEWADLSRYAAATRADATHDHVVEPHAEVNHFHVDEDGDVAHGIAFRHRVLGLAWYSGKVTLDTSLEHDPELAAEVLLAEGAHMVDFFYMTDPMRVAVWNAVHPPDQHLPADQAIHDGVDLGHGHGWFDVASYREWVGEEFMGLFVRAFSDVPVTIPFAHTWDADALAQVRAALLGAVSGGVFGRSRSSVFHDSHAGVVHDIEWPSRDAAIASGRRPCGICRP